MINRKPKPKKPAKANLDSEPAPEPIYEPQNSAIESDAIDPGTRRFFKESKVKIAPKKYRDKPPVPYRPAYLTCEACFLAWRDWLAGGDK